MEDKDRTDGTFDLEKELNEFKDYMEDLYVIETPVEDALIDAEWQGMVDQSKEQGDGR